MFGVAVCCSRRSNFARTSRGGGHDDGSCYGAEHHIAYCLAPPVIVEVPFHDPPVRRTGWLRLVSSTLIMHACMYLVAEISVRSTKLDAETRLALQQEKEALETKLLEV